MHFNGRTFLLKDTRDPTHSEMIELGLSPSKTSEFIVGRAPGLKEPTIYARRYVLPPRGRIPTLSHKKLWELGRKYAEYAAPHIVEQARTTNYRLPIQSVSELYPVLIDIYKLLETEQHIPWDNLLAIQQDDFLTGFWNRLRERHILDKSIVGTR